MPLLPTKSRTISLTIQKPASGKDPQSLQTPSQGFVSKYIPSTGIAGAVSKNLLGRTVESTLNLVGPTAIDITFEADIASESGLFTSFLQPWSMKPTAVTIKGESYLGAFPLISNADTDVKDILARFRSTLNDFSGRLGTPGTGRRVLLEFRNNPDGARRFLGFIRRFHFGESISAHYLLPYEIDFIGRPVDGVKISEGREDGRRSLARYGG